jgi:hypothetical protein
MPLNALLPFEDVRLLLDKVEQTKAQITKLGRQKYIRLLEYSLRFAEHQLDKKVAGKGAYERDNGDHDDTWVVEINMLFMIYVSLSDNTLYHEDGDHHISKSQLQYWNHGYVR